MRFDFDYDDSDGKRILGVRWGEKVYQVQGWRANLTFAAIIIVVLGVTAKACLS